MILFAPLSHFSAPWPTESILSFLSSLNNGHMALMAPLGDGLFSPLSLPPSAVQLFDYIVWVCALGGVFLGMNLLIEKILHYRRGYVK